MWIAVLLLLLLGAQLNVTALVPLQLGGTPPPWWVGGAGMQQTRRSQSRLGAERIAAPRS